uniref:RING-type domain-containing protein n=1 Tax=Pyrodinium bahamense TaxID=73915 RepID=A0A7R9ZVM9_9DINO
MARGSPESKPRHLAGLELIILSILFIRAMRALPPALTAVVIGIRQLWRLGRRMVRRFLRWRDRHWRRPRYTLRCDLAAVEPGMCPVCLAPLAGQAFGEEEEAEEGCENAAQGADAGEGSNSVDGGACRSACCTQGANSLRGRPLPPAPERRCPSSAGALFRLRCGHTFHAECLNGWLDRGGTCPLCRADVGDLREWVELLGLSDDTSARTVTLPVAPAAAPAPPLPSSQGGVTELASIAIAQLAEPMLQSHAGERGEDGGGASEEEEDEEEEEVDEERECLALEAGEGRAEAARAV